MARQEVHNELDRVCADFVQLIDHASVAEMRRPTAPKGPTSPDSCLDLDAS